MLNGKAYWAGPNSGGHKEDSDDDIDGEIFDGGIFDGRAGRRCRNSGWAVENILRR